MLREYWIASDQRVALEGGEVYVVGEPKGNMEIQSISQGLSSSLETHSERPAIEDSSGRWLLTYDQLSTSADLFRKSLTGVASRPLLFNMQKSAAYYAAVTACFAFGISFCPVDLINPIERVSEIAKQFADCVLVTDDAQRYSSFARRGLKSALISADGTLSGTRISRPPRLCPMEEPSPCYYIATSGSTGRPKIVRVPHRNTCDFVNWAVEFYNVDSLTRWAQFSSIGFDLSLVDILTVLVGGGTLIALSSRLDRFRPAKVIKRCNITHWHSVPSVIPYILAEEESVGKNSSCRLFTFCGEPLARVDVDRLRVTYPSSRIVNTYGPTEGTLFCSFYEYSDPECIRGAETVPIGLPIPGWYFVYLDESDVSRLIIVSNNVADGYVGQESSNFAVIELFGTPVRAFDTGDYFSRKGSLVYFSHRRDAMVKIGGNRVDLGEVEAAAKRIGITNPIALYVDGALVMVGEGMSQEVGRLRESLSDLLPVYSIPSAIYFHGTHPRTANGKIDRSAIRKEYFST